ncbi:hypothetical protein ACRPHP_16745 [Pantoea allii]|uniref:hypothetical protein n=1 Tax=Pantoea allii TaxID=574096 RepID=UPI003D79571C
MSEISKLIAEIKSEGILRAGNKLEHLYSLAEQKEKDYAALQQKLDAISAKAIELCSEAAHVYQKYNITQMPDRDLVDHQTIQELSDLISSGTHDTSDKAG